MLSVMMKGSGYERGKAHGQALKTQIHKAYQELCAPIDLPPAQKTRHINDFLEKLHKSFPDMVREIEGIATGSDLAVNQIGELVLWEELKAIASQVSKESSCTAIAFTHTPDGPVVGKTSDIEHFQQPYYVLEYIEPDTGYPLLSMGKVGSTKTEIGINQEGLCVATGSLLPCDDGEAGIERMTLARIVLQVASNVDEAIALISCFNLIRLGLYFLLVDASGKACVVEKGIAHQGFRFPDHNGVIFATNFYMAPVMRKYIDRSAFYYQNALERYVTLLNIASSSLPQEGLKGMQKVLRDHSFTGPICAHFEQLGLCSLFAYIVLPEERKMMIADGYPCQVTFQEFGFQSFTGGS